MLEEFKFSEKYRPLTVADTILPEPLKAEFQTFVDKEAIPDLLLVGPQGAGKTTIARAMLEQLGCDYIIINGSMNGNIDTLRTEIKQFASSISLSGGRKYVILDEADYLNANSTQPALRNFMEEYSANCGFILTANFGNKIIKPLHSRCSVIDFRIKKKDLPVLAVQFLKRMTWMLDQEGIEYEKAAVVEVIKKYFPDWRRVVNELQRYSATGRIDSGILSSLSDVSMRELIGFMKERNFTEIRKWAAENIDSDPQQLYRELYDSASNYMAKESIPQLVLHLAKYQYQAAFVADQEVNMVACLTEIMVDCKFL